MKRYTNTLHSLMLQIFTVAFAILGSCFFNAVQNISSKDGQETFDSYMTNLYKWETLNQTSTS